MQLSFELPRNFINPDKYRPDQSPDDLFAAVPDVITRSIFGVMDVNVPIDALNPFVYVRNGLLPEFVVVFFMNMVAKRIKSNMSRFFTAMHLIEMYREYVIIPPHHFMAVDSAAVVASEAVEEKSDEGKKEESEESDVKGKSDDTDHDKNDQLGPSTSKA